MDGRQPLHSLLLVSRMFYQASSSDTLWSKIKARRVLEIAFEGLGNEGSVKEEWERYRSEAGLPVFNIMKLQWLAHNASRLKIFYGTLKRQSASKWSFLHCMSDVSSDHSYGGDKIVIVGHTQRLLSDNTPSPSTTLLQQLMYLIPSSATLCHRDPHCRSILSGFTLREIEPSPSSCRSRRVNGVDSGIRVESHSHYPALTYRRVGDDRLSVLQFDHQEGQFSYKRELYRVKLQELFEKCVGTILVLDYKECKESADLNAVFRSLHALVTHHLWSKSRSDSNVLQDMNIEESNKAVQRSSSTTSPLLVLVAIPRYMNGQSHSQHSKREVEGIVQQVGSIVRAVLSSDRGQGEVKRSSQNNRMWYVQPIDRDCELGVLDKGIFAGMNWLVRAMVKSKQ